ncbi:MAG: pyridoxamine kinase [Clostridiaceae bacterium]|nr:pyridoxamine kinase [Clostridiaceae bacterium]
MQKKVAAFHDISGFGRCALTTAIPILSACGIQCCPVPSAVLSAHTAFKDVTFRDLTDDLDGFIKNWEEIGVKLDGVYSGYLGSEKQIEQVLALRRLCGKDDCLMIVDPVMGDNGKAYSIVKNQSFITSIRWLCSQADVITPNLTECALLLGMEPDAYENNAEAAAVYMKQLVNNGARKVVVTGLEKDGQLGAGYIDSLSGETGFVFHKRVPVYFPGTGDLFTSVLIARLIGSAFSLKDAVYAAAHFVMECASYTDKQGTAPIEGVQFEKLLYKLITV